MTRCDYDSVFYRVFCITLLSIGFTFTIILTNVFVDLDGLLTNKKVKTNEILENTPYAGTDLDITFTPEIYKTEAFYDDTNYDDVDYNDYRTKRSLDSHNFIFPIKNPKMKRILTSRLSTLLEELDTEENASSKKTKLENVDTSNEKLNKGNIKQTKDSKEGTVEAKKEDLLHLAMHNIILQGIIGHMDLNEVYKRVHSLAANFNEYNNPEKGEPNPALDKEKRDPIPALETNSIPITEEVKHSKSNSSVEERKFMEELMNCKDLRDEIINGGQKNDYETKKQSVTHKAPKMIIKTIIDITSNDIRKKANETNSRDNIKGIIKLIYNGKSIKFSRMDDDEVSFKSHIEENIPKDNSEHSIIDSIRKAMYNEATNLLKDKSHNNYNKFIIDYLKRNSNYEGSSEVKRNMKRLKRHIKIRYENDDVTENPKKHADNKDDDELYVEIETHFDSKGMKGEKKKKLIRSLIEKIQKAIHSNGDETKKKKHKYLNVKKRTQNSLNNENLGSLVKKMILPYEAVIHRHLDPIAKSVPIQEPMPYVTDKLGENWKKTIKVPGFLSVSKAINSAEMSEVDVDYNKILSENGIPQRLQKPLNTDLSEETVNEHFDNDFNNIKFLVKDIDGSGFSVGFNQYVDEPPDSETMKIFTGLENVLQTYHQIYDQEQDQPPAAVSEGDNVKNNNEYSELKSENLMSGDHTVVRRSADAINHDHHSNEYKIIFDADFLPYNSYQDIYNNGNAKNVNSIGYNHKAILNVDSTLKQIPFILDKDIFNKNLKPAEIFSLASLLERQKRSLNVKKISNLKSKIKLNRILNTKAMTTKTIFLNKKRNKRQIDKIRIIATDDLPNVRKHSDDDIFLVSDENNMFADRAIVKELDMPEIEHDRVVEDHYDLITPYVYEEPEIGSYDHTAFGPKSRRNSLMSRYPHIFMEEISRSKEEDQIPDNSLILNKMIQKKPVEYHIETTTVNTPSIKDVPLPKIEEIVNAIVPQNGKTNYKLTVKILPKNSSDMNSGFKEIHTSINKSYNKNGLLYSSLVNVSEISKVIKVNDTEKEPRDVQSIQHSEHSPSAKNIKTQQEKINLLLKQHKDRIDEQLNHLNIEKQKLEHLSLKNMSESNAISENDFIDLVIPSNPPKIMHLRKDEVNSLAAATLFKLQEDVKAHSSTVSTTESTTEHTTIKTTLAPPDDVEKRKIMRTVQRNENLTSEILKKIDRNTEILQMFLQKLTDKLDASVTRQTTERPDVAHPIKYDFNVRKNFNNNIPDPFSQIMPNMEVNKNNTHFSIPFVYAYQQPYPLPVNNPEIPVASVVYHGHIHTNTIQNQNPQFYKEKEVKSKNINNNKLDANQTKFFIDELENDYKMYPVNHLKKNDFSPHALNDTNGV